MTVRDLINGIWARYALLWATLLAPALAPAATITITADTNWSAITTGTGAGGQPSAADDIIVKAAATLTVNVTNGVCKTLLLGHDVDPNKGNGTLAFSAATSQLTVSGLVTLGDAGRTGTVTMTSGGTLTLQGFNAVNVNDFAEGAGTVVLTASNTLPNDGKFDKFNNLTINGPGTTTTLGRNIQLAGNLTITAGTLSASTFDIDIKGNFTNFGTFNGGTGAVKFDGTTPQTITGSPGGTTVFRNLRLDNDAGLSFVGTHSAQVTSTVTLSHGIITTNANVLYMSTGGTINGVAADRFIFGNLKKRFSGGTDVTRQFEVGTVVGGVPSYTPVVIKLGSVTGPGDFTVSGTAGDHPLLASSTLDPAKSVNRYWTLTNNSVTFAAHANNQIDFNFQKGDSDAGANFKNYFVSRFAGGVWSNPELTPTGRTDDKTTIKGATNITMANIGGDYAIAEKGTLPAAPASFNAFETATTPNPGAIAGRIFTKLAGTGFSLDVVAILGGVQHSTFTTTTKKVLVDLVTGSTGGANCPGSPVAIAGTSQTMDLVSGRGTTGSFTVASAVRDVRVRMRYPDDVPTVTACSTDNFSIRPGGFSISSSMTNAGTSGTPVAKAGAPFTITAVALAGYDGTPAIDSTLLSAHAGAVQVGSVGGTFGAANPASGTAVASAATYGEVGNFTIGANGVFDASFTSVDQAGGDCTNDFSTSLVGGKYGCKIGNTAASAPIGRFTPDHFDVDLTTTPPVFNAGCVAGGFTYLGQSFSYGTQPKIYVAAKNASNAVTKNYTGTWWSITNGTLTGRTYAAASGTLDTSGLPATTVDPTILDTGNGTGTLTFSSGTGLVFTRTTPVAPFNAELSLSINVIDADGVIYASNPARFGQASAGNGISFNGGKAMRFGRLAIANRSGSQLLPLQAPIEAQYWNGTTFVTNTLDNCTAVAPGNVAMGGYAGTIDPGAGACKTAINGGGTLAAGRGTVMLSAPAGGASGSVNLTVNLDATASGNVCSAVGAPPGAATTANRPFLQGNWTGSSFDQNPTGRATFGVYTGAEEVIFTRENF